MPPTSTYSLLATRHSSHIRAEVVRVIDGDTAVFRINNTEETVRFLGIDAPETVHPDKPVECFGPEASEFVKSVLEEETAVYLELDEMTGERDKYGRLLAHIWLEDGTLFNELLLQEGYAEFSNYGNATEKDGRYTQAQSQAQSGKTGVWVHCVEN
ncbi:MAG: nuclease [Chloroflexi bacterium]|nr:MAG: nuclease [Chloroflexota bacterium]